MSFRYKDILLEDDKVFFIMCDDDDKGYNGFTYDTLSFIMHSLVKDYKPHDLIIKGGEPFSESNLLLLRGIVSTIALFIPVSKIFIYTKYSLDDLEDKLKKEDMYQTIRDCSILIKIS